MLLNDATGPLISQLILVRTPKEQAAAGEGYRKTRAGTRTDPGDPI